MPKRRSPVRKMVDLTPEIRAAFTLVPEDWAEPARVCIATGAARTTITAIFRPQGGASVTAKLIVKREDGRAVVVGQDVKFRFKATAAELRS